VRLAAPSLASIVTGAFVTAGVLWGGFLGAAQISGVGSFLDGFEYLTLDWRYALAGPRPVPRGVVIAAIDDETVHDAGAYPLPRGEVARIIRGLAALNPEAIAVDIAFLDAGQAEEDKELAEALQSSKSVIAAIGVFDGERAPDRPCGASLMSGVPSPTRVFWPTASLRDSMRSGLVNVTTDSSGIPRFTPMIYCSDGAVVPSFALAAASVALGAEPVLGVDALKLAARSVSTDIGYHLPIRYYGPRGAIRQFSAARIIHGDLKPDDVRGQLVILGATALGVGDTFATPFDRVVPGAEIFGTAITNLLAGDGLIRTVLVRRIDAGAAVLLPSIAILLMAMRRPFAGLGLAGLLFALFLALAFIAFLQGYWFSVAIPLAAAGPVALAYGAARLGLDRYAAGRLKTEKAALAKFQSPLLIEHILRNPGFLESPVQQGVAVVFLDLSGFTGVAEILGPLWTRDLLAAFQALIEGVALGHRGFVVSFMGDGAMIVFGLPEPRPDDASRALVAIARLREAIDAWLAALPSVAHDRLRARIGGHFGPAVVSLLGPAHHRHVAATGDTVNVASRLLEVAKDRQCGVVISEELCAAAVPPWSFPGGADVVALEVRIRGRAQPLRIRTWG
jgi:adenylate cyclase